MQKEKVKSDYTMVVVTFHFYNLEAEPIILLQMISKGYR